MNAETGKRYRKMPSQTLGNPSIRSGLRILLAEDNEVNQRVASLILKRLGYHCSVVCNGQEAWEALEADHFDIVLMDCNMPIMDGLEATKVIRKSETEHVPIVALTANVLNDAERNCYDAGMDDFITKPVSPDVLRRTIEKWTSSGQN